MRNANGDVVRQQGFVVMVSVKAEVARVECGCQRYVGPEPLPSVYAEELTR